MLVDIAETGKSVSLIISGSSMTPFLAGERDRVVFEKPGRELKAGDMVFYRRLSGQYVMHRIRFAKADGYYLIGDGQQEKERGVRKDQVLALVTAVRRKGTVLQRGSFWWDFFEKVWIRMVPLRPAMMKTYACLKKLFG
jgi:hypothetical protein